MFGLPEVTEVECDRQNAPIPTPIISRNLRRFTSPIMVSWFTPILSLFQATDAPLRSGSRQTQRPRFHLPAWKLAFGSPSELRRTSPAGITTPPKLRRLHQLLLDRTGPILVTMRNTGGVCKNGLPNFAVSLVSVLLLGACSEPPNERERPPNIIFILADDLGYGDLEAYGQERIRTPNLSRLAEEGIRFTDFYAGSTVCAPSRCVLMTGLHTGHAYIRGNGKYNLRPEDLTVAELLRGAGYVTGQIGKWGLGHEGSNGIPTKQGFDYFFGYLDQHHAHNYFPSFLIRNEERVYLENVVPEEGQYHQGVASIKVEYSHDLMAREALDFIARNAGHPFFLYLSFTIPHANNEAGNEGMEVPDCGVYAEEDWPQPQKGLAAMITRLDTDVGRIVEALSMRGIEEETVIFFTSDNGPHAEGGNNPDFFDSNGPLRGIKRHLYEGGIRVPMIVRWKGKTPAGSVSNHVGYFGDWMATAAELAGLPETGSSDSISFLPVIIGDSGNQRSHDYLYWEFYERGSAQAVRMGRWKGLRKPMFSGPIELYDLSSDLGEEVDVASDHRQIVERIEALMTEAHTPSDLWKIE